MKYRYLPIMVLILILSIGAVCAQDAADAGDAATGNGDVLTVDNNVNTLESEISYGSSVSVENDAIPENANISDNDKLAGNINEDVLKESAGEEITVTNDTFYNYFDDEGYLKDNITADTLIFSGEFFNLPENLIIEKPIKLLGEDATLIDMGIIISSDNVLVENFIFINDALPEIIQIGRAQNVSIINSEFYLTGLKDGDDYRLIGIRYSDKILIDSNEFVFNVTADNTNVNVVIAALETDDLIISGNAILAYLPARPIWTIGDVYSQGIRLKGCNNAVLEGNEIYINSNNQITNHDILYAVSIGGDNATVSANQIAVSNGCGIVISGENFIISDNLVDVSSDNTFAGAVYIEDKAEGTVYKNIIEVSSPFMAYGIYADSYGGNQSVYCYNNTIVGESDEVYGIALLSDGTSCIEWNNIRLMGNHTLGVVEILNDVIPIFDNDIFVYGVNKDIVNETEVPRLTVGIYSDGGSQIYGNAITSSGNWSVFNSGDNSNITGNYLVSSELLGDDSVNNTSEATTVENNIPTDATNYNVTTDNFFLFFDDSGYLRDNITSESLTFQGEFSNIVPVINIDKPIKLLGDNATMNVRMMILSDNVTVDGFNFNGGKRGRIVLLDVENVQILNNNFSVDGYTTRDNVFISVSNSNNVLIENNTVTVSVKTNGTHQNTGIFAENSDNLFIIGNTVVASLPARPINWTDGTVYSQGVFLDGCDNAVLEGNEISVKSNDQISEYDTIYAVHINGDNATVSENNIAVEDAPYGYGIVISGENFNIGENNTISVLANGTYACGIEVDGTSYGVIEHNIVNVIGESAYGIYTANWAGDVVPIITDNGIMVQGVTAFGMSLSGSEALVSENLITMDNSNFTTGIASAVDDITINNNTIRANGSNVGTPAGYDTMGIETTGVHIVGGNAEVINNEIIANNKYTVDFAGKGQVTDNYLVGTDYTGDASVNYTPSQDIIVKNNIPAIGRAVISAENVVMYYKNGTRYVAVLTDQNGNPLSNKTVTLTVNNVSYNRTTDDNGTVSLALNLNSGNFNASALFAGDYNYSDASIVNNISVLPTVFGEDLVKVYQNESQYYATFLDNQGNPLADGTEVTFNINGVMYKRNVNGDEGKAKLNINLPQGEYIITALNPITNELASNNITVLATIQNNTDLVKYYRNESQYVVTLIGDDGNPVGAGENVTFNINGVFYTRQTNESGQAKLNINLPQGNYTITAQYRGCSVSNNIEVLPVLNASDLEMKYMDGSTFKATLVDGQGKPYAEQKIQFNINGVFYNKKTDSSGLAELAIRLPSGEYIITSSYNGCNIVNKITITG